MTRLTTSIRESIARAAVAHAFDPREEAMSASEDGLAREAYASLIPDAERKAIERLPANWARRDPCLRFNAAGYRVQLCTKGDPLPVPYAPPGSTEGGYGCNEIGAIPQGDLSDRVQAHVQSLLNLRGERNTAYRSVLTMLGGVTTLSRLKDVWPEGEQFYGRFAEAKTSLPAVRVDEVNAALGLAQAA